ncbi:MAG TPA: glycine dehydrogenase (aminomethyl-transferring), partial [Thermoanaerobaculia bacterium]
MPAPLQPTDTFVRRHLGPDEAEVREMLDAIGADSLERLVGETVPESIRLSGRLSLSHLPEDRSLGERETLGVLGGIASRNQVFRSFLGMGYHDCLVPTVIQRNVLENPGWYTQYTPYQAEISQGRLEALLNYQTMVADLTGLPVANASLLDEGTAAAEAMHMCVDAPKGGTRNTFFVAADCHPQTIEVVKTRAGAIGVEVRVGDAESMDLDDVFGVLLQYPNTEGRIRDYSQIAERAHQAKAMVVMATDLLALTLLRPPGEIGADIAVGSTQRFGVPMGYGGPHAAFLATRDEHKRQLPGRVIGVSRDRHGRTAFRM